MESAELWHYHSNPKLLQSLDNTTATTWPSTYCYKVTCQSAADGLSKWKHQGQFTWKMDRINKQLANAWPLFWRQEARTTSKRQVNECSQVIGKNMRANINLVLWDLNLFARHSNFQCHWYGCQGAVEVPFHWTWFYSCYIKRLTEGSLFSDFSVGNCV